MCQSLLRTASPTGSILPHTTAYPSRLCCSCQTRRSCLTLPVMTPGAYRLSFWILPNPYFSSSVTLTGSKVGIPSPISQMGKTLDAAGTLAYSVHSPEPHPTGRSVGRTPGHSLSSGRGPPQLHSKACCKWTTVVSSLVPFGRREKHKRRPNFLVPILENSKDKTIPPDNSARRNKSVLLYSHPARQHFPQEKKGILYS